MMTYCNDVVDKLVSNVEGKALNSMRVPRATYRFQFNHQFTFSDATQLIHYLSELGVSHCYASPYLKARPGSMHGYDIIDHNTLNPEIGSDEDFERFNQELAKHGMGQILDIVPNHMGVMGSDNNWWLDILENGQASQYAEFFDIDWEPPKEELRDKVLIPTLGDQYGKVLENGELKLSFDIDRGEFNIWYYTHRFPIDPKQYPQIILHRIERFSEQEISDSFSLLELQSLATAFGHLPNPTETEAGKRIERNRDKEIHKRNLSKLCKKNDYVIKLIQENIEEFNGNVDDPKSFDLLHNLIKTQAYRLAYWRVAADDINYRRFFDINDLAALRMESEDVFSITHRLIFDLVAQKKIDGLRIDHPDGLFDPMQYFSRLQQQSSRPFYFVIEKIIASYERMPKQWPVCGTTGYRFASVVNGLFVDTKNEKRMDRVYSAFIGEKIDYLELLYRCKKLIMRVNLASQLNVLANELSRIALSDRRTCDFTVNSLRDALVEVTACFPVYRTYITETQVSPDDQRFIDWAVTTARKRGQAADVSIFDFIRDVLLTNVAETKPAAYRKAVINFAMRFQQFSSPVTAKAVEDTGFYIYNRLVSLNEVGGDPGTFGMTITAFHGATLDRAKNWPYTMIATSTHDGKRSEDVRARINVISELPALWRLRLRRWSRVNRRKKALNGGEAFPSRNDEYLIYQTLIGAWPLDSTELDSFVPRVEAYMLKAVREAKQHSSWLNPSEEYETALSAFIRSLLIADEKNLFLSDFVPFQKMISRLGMFNSLAQTLIKFTSPGVPDIYQGNELWDYSLVDPDNRRPVDYGKRNVMLHALKVFVKEGSNVSKDRVCELLQTMDDGRIKLYLTWRILTVRREFEMLFREGDYIPLRTEGSLAENVCAYARVKEGKAIVVATPRLFFSIVGDSGDLPVGEKIWQDTRIELNANEVMQNWTNTLTGDLIPVHQEAERYFIFVKELFENFPYGLLTNS